MGGFELRWLLKEMIVTDRTKRRFLYVRLQNNDMYTYHAKHSFSY
jgi:hypothetical protein